MILDCEINKRSHDAAQLHHAMRCMFLYMFYAKVKEVHGAIAMPVERLTPAGTMSYKVTRANTGIKDVRRLPQLHLIV